MKKRNVVAAMILCAAVSVFTACGGSGATTGTEATKVQETTAAAAASETTAAASDETTAAADSADTTAAEAGDSSSTASGTIEAGVCQTPAIITSIGQSADVDIVKTLFSKAGIDAETNATITADELPADCKTLVLAVGGSSKGLGAAGIDADQELERTSALLEKAKSQGTTILAMHTGGSARRGTLSDSFIEPSFEAADVAIVVSEGDTDGLMKGILDGNGAQYQYIDQITDAIDVLKTAFGV